MIDEADMRVVKTLSNKVHTESVVWIVIAVFQILSIVGLPVGVYTLSGSWCCASTCSSELSLESSALFTTSWEFAATLWITVTHS